MDHHRPRQSSHAELRVLDELQGVSGVGEVQSFAGGYSVEFPEADFVIRISTSEAPCETQWEVTVREPLPGLSTWFGQWQRSFSVHRTEAGPLIAAEMQAAHARVRGMLDDRARALSDV